MGSQLHIALDADLVLLLDMELAARIWIRTWTRRLALKLKRDARRLAFELERTARRLVGLRLNHDHRVWHRT